MNDGRNPGGNAPCVSEDVRLPVPKDFPTKHPQSATLLGIPTNVVRDFREPVFRICSASQQVCESCPIMPVPKVPIAKDGEPGTPEDEIWFPRELRDVSTASDS